MDAELSQPRADFAGVLASCSLEDNALHHDHGRASRSGVLQEVLDEKFINRAVLALGDVQRRLATLRRERGEGGGGGRRKGEKRQELGGAEKRCGACAGPLLPPLNPTPPRPGPSCPSLTLVLRLASAPALSSDSTQEARHWITAQCSAV